MRITSVSSAAKLNKIQNLLKEKESIETRLINTSNLEQAKKEKQSCADELKEMRINSSKNYISTINKEMSDMNDIITAPNKKTPPELSLTESGKNYIFKTSQDQGRGTQYKGMVIFDLVMLKQTVLPALIHDSDLLQPVEYNPVDGIARQYNKSEKQIFVAIDKLASYKTETQKIFKEKMVIELYPGGGELFGEAWNKK